MCRGNQRQKTKGKEMKGKKRKGKEMKGKAKCLGERKDKK